MATGQDLVLKLKKELKLTRDERDYLASQLQDKNNMLLKLDGESKKYYEELATTRNNLNQVEKMVQERVDQEILKERLNLKEKTRQIDDLKTEIKTKDNIIELKNEEIDRKQAEIDAMNQRLRELKIGGFEMSDALKDIKNYREEKLQAQRKIQELTTKLNNLEDQLDDVVSENRYLRELAEVADNYGVIKDIKFTSKQKNEDYKRLLAASEKARAEREKEVADLRHQLIQMTVLYNDVGENERYRGLNMEQLHHVDQFVLKLKEGKLEIPLNDKSKELEMELNKLKAQLEYLENKHLDNLDNVIQKLQGTANLQKSMVQDDKTKTQAQTLQPTDDLYNKLMTLVDALSTKTMNQSMKEPQQQDQQGGTHMIQWPPVPLSGPFGNWSDVREGYSYRFKTKFPVDMGEFYSDQGFDQVAARYEIAALQLHNLENIELLERKEREINTLSVEIEEIKTEMKNMLLVEDELFKQYVTEKDKFTKKLKEVELENRDLKIKNQENEHKIKLLEDLNLSLRKTDEKELRSTISEYAKKISIQEVNLIRLSRKYDALQSEEKDLREAYHKTDTAFAAKEAEMNERLAQLTAWKSKATHQLKLLFDLQINSVSKEDYQSLRGQLELMQEKYADMKIKEAQYLSKISSLQSMERQNISQEELIKDLREDMMETELEMEMMSKRLEELDPVYKKYNIVMRMIVEIITKGGKSPLYFFERLDTNGNGKLDKREFEMALFNMQVHIERSDFENFFNFLDQDGSGSVEYREFIKKLKRSGAKFRTPEDELVFFIYDIISKASLSLQSAFDMFDIDKDKMISKDDMISTFSKWAYKVDLKKVEEFFILADMNKDSLINFEEFYRLFDNIIREAHKEESKHQLEKLNWKMEIMYKIDKAIKASNLTLWEAFKMIDHDKSGKIKFQEFQEFFRQAGRDIQEIELRNLFNDIDKDRSGEINFPEFQYYFNSVKREKERIDRMKNFVERADHLREASMRNIEKLEEEVNNGSEDNINRKLNLRIALLETREKNAIHKIDILQIRNKSIEDELKKQDRQMATLEEQILKYQELYYNALGQQNTLEKRLEGTLGKDKAKSIYKLNQKLAIERQELKRNMNTFKSLYEASVNQIKILKLSIEKEKNEIETYQSTVRELQAQTDENTLIGKLQHELMISKWNEGVSNKKYNDALDQARKLKLDIESFDAKYEEKEDEIISVHNNYREKVGQLEKTVTETKLKIIPTLTMAKIEDLSNKIKEIYTQKSELEKQNRKLVDEISTIRVDLDYLQTHKQTVEDMTVTLKNTKTDELSQEFIKVSEKLSEYKLAELKAKREQIQLIQREDYYQKLIKEYTSSMKELEESVSKWEIKFTQREDYWRKTFNEKMKATFEKEGYVTDSKPKAEVKAQPEYAKTGEHLKDMNLKHEEMMYNKSRIQELENQIREKDNKLRLYEDQFTAVEKTKRALPDVNGPMRQASFSIRDAINDEEAKKFASEAQKIIQALQEIIDDKNKQLERKEKEAADRREQYMAHKNEDAREIKKLHEALEKAQKAQFERHQTLAPSNNAVYSEAQNDGLNALLIEKDGKIDFLKRQLDTAKDHNKDYALTIKKLELDIISLKDQLAQEKDRNDQSNLMREIQKLQNTIKVKEQELQAQKKFIDDAKETYKRIESVSSINVLDMKNQLTEKDKHIEIKMKAATTHIEDQNKKIQNFDKEVRELKKADIENNAKITLLKEDISKLKADIKKEEDNVAAEKKINKDLVRQIEGLRSDLAKRGSDGVSDKTAKELHEKIAALEKQNKALTTEKPADFFDDKGYLKGDGKIGFSGADPILARIGKWVKRQGLNIQNEFTLADKDKTGWIPTTKVLAILDDAGIKIQDRDQKTLFAEFKKNRHGEIEHLDFYQRMKGTRDFPIQTEEEKPAEAQTPLHFTKESKTGMTDKEKTLTRGLEIMKLEVANLKKENDKLEKQLFNWKENYSKLDKEYKALLGKPIAKVQEESDPNKKITSIHKLESVQELRDKIFELENKVAALEKKINTENEPLIKKLKQDKEKLENEVKGVKTENLKVTAQMDMIKAKKMTPEAMKEEVIYEKDMIISNLKEKLDVLRNKENALENKLFELEQKNLELLLDKEGHDIVAQRLNRRIQELEDFKTSYNELKNATMTSTMKKK